MTSRLGGMMQQEAGRGVSDVKVFRAFIETIERLRRETRAVLERHLAAGRTIAGYGAAAKATTLMHVFGIGRRELAFIADKSSWKQGLAMPVTHVPIVSPAEMRRRAPDVILLLAWNFADEIIAESRDWLGAGGRFVVPVPEVREVMAEDERVAG